MTLRWSALAPIRNLFFSNHCLYFLNVLWFKLQEFVWHFFLVMKSKKIHQVLEAYMRIKPLSVARAVACVKQIIVGRYFICGTCFSSSNENIPDFSYFQLRSQTSHLNTRTWYNDICFVNMEIEIRIIIYNIHRTICPYFYSTLSIIFKYNDYVIKIK